MTKIHVTAKRDFLESLANGKPMDALAEIIWNVFDADATRVQVFLQLNAIDGIESIRVRDYGYGIDRQKVENLFGNLGDSWKKRQHRQNGRALHGKNGKGRFKVFGLGQDVEWRTAYKEKEKLFTYTIKGSAQSLDDFDISDPVESNSASLGTEVTIHNLKKDFRSLRRDTAPQELATKFAAYLTEYPNLILEYDGEAIDPKIAQHQQQSFSLGEIEISDGRKIAVDVSVIEWNIPTDRVFHLCDSQGISLSEITGQSIKAPGFNFTAYIKTDYFRELDSANLLGLSDLHQDVQLILKAAKSKIKEHFRVRLLEKQGMTVERWKKENIYPYPEKSILDPVELAERQVFDILAVNIESYLPSFEDSDERSKKFTFRLLAQAIQDNPHSVQQIIGEVLGLKKEDQDDLAELLRRTSLSSIISSAKIVANRLDFLNGLENLLFDKENKKILLERDQLHKILEQEAWLFSEDFSLSGSEERLEEVLRKHLEQLGPREDDPSPVIVGDGKQGRIDLFFHKVNQPRTGHYDYLVVELKRPSKKIDAEVLTQIKKYAIAVAGDERFTSIPSNWTFIAVSNEFDSFAESEANQKDKPKGLVSDNPKLNFQVWIKTWSEIINNARARLRFVNELLAYQADNDSAKEYLDRTHAKYIPPAPAATPLQGEVIEQVDIT